MVSVIHFDVGLDRTLSIEQFLRSLKRDRNSFAHRREAQKRRRLNSGGQHLLVETTEGDTDPTLDHDTQINYPSNVNGSEARIERDKHGVFERPTVPHHQVRKVYKGKQKNVAVARFASDLSLPASLQSDHESNLVQAPLEGYSSDDQAATSSLSGLPKKLTRRLRPRKIRNESSRSVKGTERAKRARRHAPVNELPLVASIEEGVSAQEREFNERITNAIGLAADPVETCTQAGTTPRRPNHNYANSRRLSVPKPLCTIQKSFRLSKDNSINPRDFKIPPQTPAGPKTTSWRLGSGFKNRERPNAGKRRNILPDNEKPAKPSSPQKIRTRQSEVEDVEEQSVVSLHGTMNQQKPRIGAVGDSAPTINLTQPALHQTATKNYPWASEPASHAEQSNISTRLTAGPAPEPKRAGWQSPVRGQVVQNRTANPPPREGSIIPPEVWPVTSAPALPTPRKQDSLAMPKPHAGNSSSHATARLKTVFDAPASRSDVDQWFASRASPLRRGTSFVMTPRVEPKGHLDLSISPRLKRMASLPFKPPIKGINCTITAAATMSGASC